MPAKQTEPREELVLWNVQEEHLAEAEFLWMQRLAALESGPSTLQDLAKGVEQRLLAHVDGLVVGGVPVREQLLLKAISDPAGASTSLLTVACVALLLQGGVERVADALWTGSDEVKGAAETALTLVAVPGFEAWIARALARPLRDEHRATVLRFAARRGVAVPNLIRELQSDHLDLVRAAAQAAALAEPGRHVPALEVLLSHADAGVREAAVASALTHRSRTAAAWIVEWARNREAPQAWAMLLVGLFADARTQAILVEHLGRTSHRAAALCALGYSGQKAFVPALLECMRTGTDQEKKLAGEAFSTLTGLGLDDSEYGLPAADEREGLPALEADDLDADLVPSLVDELPLPNVEALAAWWERHAAGMAGEARVMGGRTLDLQGAVAFLRDAPLRRRHPLALWLAVKSGGKARIDTRAFAAVQYAQLAQCAAFDPRSLRAGTW